MKNGGVVCRGFPIGNFEGELFYTIAYKGASLWRNPSAFFCVDFGGGNFKMDFAESRPCEGGGLRKIGFTSLTVQKGINKKNIPYLNTKWLLPAD